MFIKGVICRYLIHWYIDNDNSLLVCLVVMEEHQYRDWCVSCHTYGDHRGVTSRYLSRQSRGQSIEDRPPSTVGLWRSASPHLHLDTGDKYEDSMRKLCLVRPRIVIESAMLHSWPDCPSKEGDCRPVQPNLIWSPNRSFVQLSEEICIL